MSHLIQTAISWRLAIFKALVGAFIIMGTMVTTGLAEADIVSPHAAKLIIFILGILIVGLKSIDMFVDQTINNLKRSRDPLGLGGDNTTVITKQEVSAMATSTTQTP